MEYGHKTWQLVKFKDVLIDTRKANRIIGMSFPPQNLSLGLEPSILTVLPDGKNVEFDMYNRSYNDNDVMYYMCSVYISGYDEFKTWASQHDPSKIIVGGYHPTTFPEDFTRYAYKIVQGPCDNIWKTIKQDGQVVFGISTYDRLPRRDLYEMTFNHQVIPDMKPWETVVSINTSLGCSQNPPCDFCCTPMMCPTLESKPIELVTTEAQSLSKYKPSYLFIRDENFTMQKDWKRRLSIIHEALPLTKIYLFASANTLQSEKSIKYMADNGVYMICLGLEDPTKQYSKNSKLDNAVALLKKNHIYVYLSFIVNPLEIIGAKQAEEFYTVLMMRFEELAPEMVCGNFLMPFRGTGMWDKYYAYVSPEDYKHYDSKTPFLVRNPIVRKKMQFFMFWYQWKYFTSDFYNKNVRLFSTGDNLNMRFLELYENYMPIYEELWDVRA